MLETVDLTVVRGPNPVVQGLSLTVEPGRIFWVVGPNGAGKSSLLRVLVGLARPTGGHVVRNLPPAERLLYFHSEMRLPPSAGAGSWGRLAHRLRRPGATGPTPLRPRVRPGAPARRLSTGEQKRLLLDVLLRQPGSLVLDEPFEHLSPDAKTELARLLQDRARSHLVIVATNQATHRARDEGGLRLEAGEARPVGPAEAAPWAEDGA